MLDVASLQGFLVGYLALLLAIGLPATLYTRSALRRTRNHAARLLDSHPGKCVVDAEWANGRLVAVVAMDLDRLAARDLIYRLTGELLFPSDRTTLCERLEHEADRAGAPFFLVRRLEWNVTVEPGNAVARRLLGSEANMPPARFLELIAGAYCHCGATPPASLVPGARAARNRAFGDAA